MNIIQRKIIDKKVILLIGKILKNFDNKEKGMPLGNLTSQFFVNVYLNEFDYFIKHKIRAKYYLRYVDDFIILHKSRERLKIWKEQINGFLYKELKLELHPDKSKIIPFSRGIDFVGFRNFHHYRLLRKRNIGNIRNKIFSFKNGEISYEKFIESFQGWYAYAKWASSYNLSEKLIKTLFSFMIFQQKSHNAVFLPVFLYSLKLN